MNIIFFSANMQNYKSANYQREFMNELNKKNKIFFYGPGFHNYDKYDDLDKIIKKSKFNNDLVLFVGHSWLSDDTNNIENLAINNNLSFDETHLFKVIFLNKEYVNLKHKLEYIKKNKFNVAFTHHHETSVYEKKTNTKFVQIPFAYSEEILEMKSNLVNKKFYDVCFTGILQNQNKKSFQSDIRLRIMKLFFHCLFDIPIIKKKKFKNIKIYWNTIPRFKIGKIIKKIFFKNLNNDEYIEILQLSKISINTLSPISLISPRFFESAACNCYILCEESSLYADIFNDYQLFEFKKDLSDFETKLFELINKKENANTIKDHEFFLNNHSWKNRVNKVIDSIKKFRNV